MSRSHCFALRSVGAITNLRAISSCYDYTVNGSKLAPTITNLPSTPDERLTHSFAGYRATVDTDSSDTLVSLHNSYAFAQPGGLNGCTMARRSTPNYDQIVIKHAHVFCAMGDFMQIRTSLWCRRIFDREHWLAGNHYVDVTAGLRGRNDTLAPVTIPGSSCSAASLPKQRASTDAT